MTKLNWKQVFLKTKHNQISTKPSSPEHKVELDKGEHGEAQEGAEAAVQHGHEHVRQGASDALLGRAQAAQKGQGHVTGELEARAQRRDQRHAGHGVQLHARQAQEAGQLQHQPHQQGHLVSMMRFHDLFIKKPRGDNDKHFSNDQLFFH